MEMQQTPRYMRDEIDDVLVIDNMLASIESRLSITVDDRVSQGNAVERVRLAVLITCFLSSNEVWKNSLIPCRLSKLLVNCLSDSIDSPEWQFRRDLQVWCILVGSVVTTIQPCVVEGLSLAWEVLLKSLRSFA